ncbi:hypothetical protein ABPG74_001383 [Tetrahymena malaccensis]
MNSRYNSNLQSAIQDQPQPAIINQVLKDTDPWWKHAFYITTGITLLVSFIIVMVGDPHKLSNPVDPNGNPCGQGDLQDYPYIYFVTPSKQYLNRTVCVKECKVYTVQPQLNDKLDCYPNSIVKSCNFNIPKSNDRSEEVLLYDTAVYLGKVCMPKNVGYYKLIFEALHISKFDQMLSDVYATFPYLVIFGFLAFILSFATKYIIDQKNMVDQSIKVYFFLSTVGFILLGVLFLFRALHLVTASQPDDKNVIGDKEKLMQEVDSSNSSFLANLLISIICFANSILYIISYCENNTEQPQRVKIVKMRNTMLEFISDIIKMQNLIYLPIFAFSIFILMSLLFFRVVLNLFSLGSTKSDDQGWPFEQFKTSGFAYFLMIFLFVGFFWIFIFILQFCEYLVYYLAIQEMNIRNERDMNRAQDQIRGLKEIFNLEIQKMYQYRIGTIAKCSILYFLLYIPRQLLESIDTSYQRKLDKYREEILLNQARIPRDDEIPHTFFMKIQRSLCVWYEGNELLKGLQPYGFFYSIEEQLGFSEAGQKMQRNIDQTAFWFEDMLNEGETFENQIKYSICFIVGLSFTLAIFSNSSLQVSTIAVPIGFMFIISYTISLLYVNMYGSIYSTFIIYYLVNQYAKDHDHRQFINNEHQLSKFEEFIQYIVGEEQGQDQLILQLQL